MTGKTWLPLQASSGNLSYTECAPSEKYGPVSSVPIAQNVFSQYAITVSYKTSGRSEFGFLHGQTMLYLSHSGNNILHTVVYWCESWSLTLTEEHRLRVFENKVLRKIFGPKRDEVTGGRRKLHNEELLDLCSSPCVIRMFKLMRIRWPEHVARIGGGGGEE
jgi:hypothetical protein